MKKKYKDLKTKYGISKCEYNIYTNYLTITGWSLSQSLELEIDIYNSGIFLGNPKFGIARPDIYNKYSEYNIKNAGWILECKILGPPQDSTIQIHGRIKNSPIFKVNKEINFFDKYNLRSWESINDSKNKLDLEYEKESKISETSKCRDSLAPFCIGDGIDIGYGGDPIVPYAICIDLPVAYARYKEHHQHLHGDGTDLTWFRDYSLDFVYSSHVLEDFVDTEAVIIEWIRVLRNGGRLILFLPDEQIYRAYSKKLGKQPNPHHIHDNFSLEYIREIVNRHENLKIVHERFPVYEYSFEIVIERTK